MHLFFNRTGKRTLHTAAFLAVCCFLGSLTAVGAVSPSKSAPGAPKPACPDSQQTSLMLAQASQQMEQAQYPEAAQTLGPLAVQHCDPRVSLLLAAALEGANNRAGAEQTLREAHSVWPNDNSLAASLAREYLQDGQPKEAADALKHFQATAAMPFQEIQVAAVAFVATHQLPAAEAVARVGYSNEPSVASLLLLANTIQLEGRYKDAIALLGDKRATYSDSAPFLVTLAQSEYDAAMYDPARADTEHAIALNSKLYAAHYLLGNVLLKVGDAEKAAAEYRIAVQLSPEQPRTYYYLALALRAQHQEADEEPLLAKAIALDDGYALAHCEMGRILLNQNRAADAVAQLERAVDDNASSEQAYYLLSRAYSRLGEQDKADATARKLAEVRHANHRSSPDKADASRP